MTDHRILFLDFDGVLHPSLAHPNCYFMHLSALEHVLRGKSCEIVISSSWRFHYTIDVLRSFLGDELGSRVGHTTGNAILGRHARYKEILSHIDMHIDAIDWRALDDSRMEFPSDCERLILCDAGRGLSEMQLSALRVWLNT